MSRFDSAIDSLQNAVDDLRDAFDTHLERVADKGSQPAGGSEGGDNMVVEVEGVHLQEDELRAMKSELHEAMTLLQAMQDTDHEAGHDAGYDQEGQ